MSKFVYHAADSRGNADHGWLHSRHTFSFAGYYEPTRMHFGALRVLNDDFVAAGMGFGTHPHDNMEIISIPLEGDLEHRDSMGNGTVIRHGDIQVMSAGTGIRHSEYNKNKDQPVKFLQIWVFPNKKNVTPRYDQLTMKLEDRMNRLQQVLSPNSEDEGVWIHQDAWFNMGRFEENVEVDYTLHKEDNGVYCFVLEGSFEIEGQILNKRDGYGISGLNIFKIKYLQVQSEILLMEVPMH
jgi:hypothetical protein